MHFVIARRASRLILAGLGAAIEHLGSELQRAARCAVFTEEEMAQADEDAAHLDGFPDLSPAMHMPLEEARVFVGTALATWNATSLISLDAETWVNGLKDEYHAYGEVPEGETCGHYDCRVCWVSATGAEG